MTYIREGEIITCEGGHQLYRITKDIQRFETFRSSQAEPIHSAMPVPEMGHPYEPCPECDRRWQKAVRGGGQRFHFEDGWR